MRIKEWLKNKLAAISLSISNVEKNTFGQEGAYISESTNQHKRHKQGTLADSLLHGEITQEVKNLRWRTYKILRESRGSKLELLETDKHGNKYYTVISYNNDNNKFKTVKVDKFDEFPVKLIFLNDNITKSIVDAIGDTNESNTISGEDFLASYKDEKPIIIGRDDIHKFDIERYTKKIVVRKITDKKHLLEFYISKYGVSENPTSIQFSKELKKIMDNGTTAPHYLDIKEVGFITENTLGAKDYLIYMFEITSFDKIIEFDGNYVVKFFADVIVDGEDKLTQFIEPELEEKYKNKERKGKV